MPAGMAGGVFTALYGSGGPIYTVYLARRLGDANRLRATIAVLIFCTAWARLALFSAHRPDVPAVAAAASRSCCCRAPSPATSSAATCTGVFAPRQAARAIWILLLASGASLVWRALGYGLDAVVAGARSGEAARSPASLGASASARKRESGSTTTGVPTAHSSGRSLIESL